MKLMHLSDLHIGKKIYAFSMLPDQEYILKQIVQIAKEQKVEGVIIAGDIYDKPVPPAEAVSLYDWFLTALAQLSIPVFAISGNHDSAERTAFAAGLLKSRGIYMSPVFSGDIQPVRLKDAYGELFVYLLPFIKPVHIKKEYEQTDFDSYTAAFSFLMQQWKIDCTKRNILVAHQFITGAKKCDSEELSIGGLDQIDADVFKDFDYVALGHLHSPQNIGDSTMRYCGTPLKYSFSEWRHQKSVTIVELQDKGNLTVDTIPLDPMRDMREIKGPFAKITSLDNICKTDDYIKVILTDENDIIDAAAKLKAIYPNLMCLEYQNSRTAANASFTAVADLRQKSNFELFSAFFEQQNNMPLSQSQTAYIKEKMETVWGEDA